jgi:His/Glu/Gln/Arg/opine family amino acid ABC transporter permease subunit
MSAFLTVYGEYISEWGPRFLAGAKVTAELSLLGFGAALVLGAGLAALQGARFAILRRLASGVVQFMRAIPLLALLLALYFGLPSLGFTLPSYWAGVAGLGLQGAAYVAEVLRGGLKSVHPGQREAGLATGMSPHKVFFFIVLPQAMRVILPPLLNCYVSLLKDSSLCSLIATDELMLAARAMSSEYFLPLHIFLLVGLFYFAIAFPLSMLSRHMARRMSRGRRALGNA